jgi:hypothetical protein
MLHLKVTISLGVTEMTSPDSREIARQAELIYERRLRTALEESHKGEFVAIEPISGDYFLGRTLSDAIQAARKAYPDRVGHVLRVGSRSAVQIGEFHGRHGR